MLTAGDILRVYCVFIPKKKYVVCVFPKHPLFFLINTEPRRISPDAQLLIKKKDFPFLQYDSYINTAMLCVISKDEIAKGKRLGHLTNEMKNLIIDCATNKGYLPQAHKDIIKNNFSS